MATTSSFRTAKQVACAETGALGFLVDLWFDRNIPVLLAAASDGRLALFSVNQDGRCDVVRTFRNNPHGSLVRGALLLKPKAGTSGPDTAFITADDEGRLVRWKPV